MFTKFILAAAALVAAQSALAAPQLSGLPTSVCMTGALSEAGSILGSLPLGTSLVTCSAGETCEPLNVIPIVGSLLPIGVSTTMNLL